VVFVVVLKREERGLGLAALMYLRLARLAGWAGIGHAAHMTPTEYGAELSQQLPAQREQINRIVHAYVAERYHPGSDAPQSLRQDWQALRRPLLLRLLIRPARLVEQQPVSRWRASRRPRRR